MTHMETRLEAAQIHENVRGPAESELERPAVSLLLSSLAGGMALGFSLLAAAYLSHESPRDVARIMSVLGYPLGFVFVLLARNELFTESTLKPVIPLLNNRDLRTLRRTLRQWALLLVGNLAGAVLFALLLARTGMVPEELHGSIAQVAHEGTRGSFDSVLYRAIFGGWLIALLTWLLAATRYTGAQIVLIFLCMAPIAALHFIHSIVGMVESFYLYFAGLRTLQWAAVGFVVPAVIGNAIGGVFLVALLNFGQVMSDKPEKESGTPLVRTAH